MNVGERISLLRKKLGITAEDLGEKVGISRATVYRYENGDIEKFPLSLLEPMANVLRTTPEFLMGWDNDNGILDIYNQLNEVRQEKVCDFAQGQLDEQNHIHDNSPVYLVGQTAAGEPVEYNQLSPEIVSDLVDVPKGADRALNVKGDSMQPLIKDGSIVFYKEQPFAENGEIAIVEIDGTGVTCKKFYFNGTNVILRSINDKYDDMIFDDGVRVIGKVIL